MTGRRRMSTVDERDEAARGERRLVLANLVGLLVWILQSTHGRFVSSRPVRARADLEGRAACTASCLWSTNTREIRRGLIRQKADSADLDLRAAGKLTVGASQLNLCIAWTGNADPGRPARIWPCRFCSLAPDRRDWHWAEVAYSGGAFQRGAMRPLTESSAFLTPSRGF